MEISSTLLIRIIIISCMVPVLLFGQAPPNYYQGVQNLEGEALKEALHNIIKDHIIFPYTSSNIDLWDILKETDQDTINPQNVILFYTGWSVDGSQEYNNGDGWTREHVWASSHGSFGNDLGAGTDAHNIRPCDGSVNSARSNLDFDNGGEIYIDSDGITENRKDSDSWEPRDEVKGDVARILFYMAVRYEGYNDDPDLELVDGVETFYLNEPNKGFHGNLSALLKWHLEDPVDDYEKNRNEVIFEFQGNRNPFIDHTDFAIRIWESNLSSYIQTQGEKFNIYPNPSSNYIQLSINQLSHIDIYTLSGELVKRIHSKNTTIDISDLSIGSYILLVQNKDYIHTSIFVKN